MLKSTLAILGSTCLVLVLVFSSCKKEIAAEPLNAAVNCDTIPHTFSNDILPIFQSNCTHVGCHTGNNQFGGFFWNDYNDIGDPSRHEIMLDAINHRPGATPMPYQMPQLPDSLIQRIECWIQNGAPNN